MVEIEPVAPEAHLSRRGRVQAGQDFVTLGAVVGHHVQFGGGLQGHYLFAAAQELPAVVEVGMHDRALEAGDQRRAARAAQGTPQQPLGQDAVDLVAVQQVEALGAREPKRPPRR